MSLRSPERGLKYIMDLANTLYFTVAPFAGAWIEIEMETSITEPGKVAPFAGAWIEMF